MSMPSTKKMPKAEPGTNSPFLTRALVSITHSDNGYIIGDLLQRADGHLETLLDAGAFDAFSASEEACKAIIPGYERANGLTSNYLADVAAIDVVDEQVEMIASVRSMERECSFALGLALGLRMAGAR
jgi:hypothetical protein